MSSPLTAPHWVFEFLPRVIPASWRVWDRRIDGLHYKQALTSLSVIVSGSREQDGKRWIHLSLAHPSRLPTWTELVDAKEWIVGKEAYAVQVIPPRSRYINLHHNCLHLFSCVDGHPLPEFTRGGETL